MFKRNNCAIAGEKLFGSIFNVDSEVSTQQDWPSDHRIPGSCVLAAGLTESMLRLLFKQADRLLTQAGPKLLAVHGSHLVWFCSDEMKRDPKLASRQQITAAKSVPKVKAMVNIEGFFVEAHQSADFIAPRDTLGFPEPSQIGSKPMMVRLGTDEKQDPVQGSSNRRHYLHLRKNLGDRHGETIYFDSLQQQADWRQKVALAPVIFIDFDSKYSVLKDLGKQDGHRILKVNNSDSGENLIARVIEIPAASERAGFESAKLQVLREASHKVCLCVCESCS